MTRALLLALFAACGSSGGGGGGGGGTSRVFHIEIPLDTMLRRCIEGALVDADPAMPGTQPMCNAWFHHTDGTDDPIAACDANLTNKPCWHLVADATCTLGDHVSLQFELATQPPTGTLGVAECLGQ